MLKTLKLAWLLCMVQFCAMPCLANNSNLDPATELITWGVTPLANGRLHLAWAKPVLDALSKRTGLKVEFGSARTLSLFLENVVDGEYDIVNLPTHIALYLMRYHGFKPVVRLKANASIVLISKKVGMGGGFSNFSKVDLVLPDPISLAGFLAEDYFLSEGSQISIRYMDNHWQVIEGVLKEPAKIGAVVDILLKFISQGTRQQIEVLHRFETQFILSNIMLVRPGTSEIFIERLQYGLEGDFPNSPIYEIRPVAVEDFNGSFDRLNKYIESIRERMPGLHQ